MKESEWYNKYVCSHRDFKRSTNNGASPVVFVFERREYKTITEEQRQEYRWKKSIVEACGGMMKVIEDHYADQYQENAEK